MTDQNNYRWYSLGDGGGQTEGFFVNSSDHILFWPGKKVPGYIVDEKTATEIRGVISDKSYTQGMVTLVGVVAILVPSIYGIASLRAQFGFLVNNLSSFPALILGWFIILPLGAYRIFLDKRKRFQDILRSSPQISQPRPKPQFLKPSERRKPVKAEARKKGRIILGAFCLFGIVMGMNSPLWGDKIFTVAAGIFVFWMRWKTRKWEETGLRKNEIVSLKTD